MPRYSYPDKQLDVFLLSIFFACALDIVPGIPTIICEIERGHEVKENALTI